MTAENVAVADATATSLTCPGGLPVASIAPGASVVCSASRTIVAADVNAGEYVNIATAEAKTPTGADFPQATATATVTRAAADLITVKALTSASATPSVGDTVTYTITVTNNGPDAATNISLSDTLPSGMTATSGNGVVSAGSYTSPNWTIASLSSGASATLTIEGTINAGQGGNSIANTTTAAVSDLYDPTTTGDNLTETVNVFQPVIAAVADTPAPISGATGGDTPSVLVNDTLNTNPVSLSLVNLTPGTLTVLPAAGSITMNADGTVTVAPGTTSGSYSYPYTICEIANPANCSGTTATIVVATQTLVAANDSGTLADGSAGGTVPGLNVATNDTLNGNPVTLGTNATITPVTAGPITVNADGSVTVAAGTPAADYPVTYELCEILNPTHCVTAVATVTVGTPALAATNDAGTLADGSAGGTVPGLNVATNDTLNGNPVTLGTNATITPVTAGPITVNADGSVTVAAGTPAADYPVTYELCEILNPTHCVTAVATVTVGTPALAATNDAGTLADGSAGGTVPGLNVATNDTLNGNPVTLGTNATITPVTAGPITVNADGSVTVAAGTPAADYPVTYELCEILNPTHCVTAVATVTVGTPALAATNDAGTLADGSAGGTVPGLNVATNDTLNGNPVTLGTNATITPVTAGPITVNADGSVTVAAGTPAADYPVTYELCEILNPTHCVTAVATVTVGTPALAATNDAGTLADGSAGGTVPGLNVATNDTLNGNPVTLGTNATITPVTAGPITVNADGSVTVAAGTACCRLSGHL